MTPRIRRIIFACGMLALVAAGLAGPAGALTRDLGRIGDLFDWIGTIALVIGVALWWPLTSHIRANTTGPRRWHWYAFVAGVGLTLIVLFWLPQRPWPVWVSATSKAFPPFFAFVLWGQWRKQIKAEAP